tara:strand:- start:242 stop:931 length:690 start_codon:yes stop_codon:yes gene_type:complete
MSGISRIQKLREDFKDTRNGGLPMAERGKEVWLKDGDQIFLSSVATGDENDNLLDELYLYTFRDGNRWTNVLKDDRVDSSGVPEDVRPSHKFAFWAYIHNIIHMEKRNDDWESIEGPGGRKMFKEIVNDFRIVSLSFGRGDYVWNQLVDVYSDWGGLNKGVMKIKRTGTGAYDTSYSIQATPKKDEIPEDKQKEFGDLEPIKDYFFERYGEAVIAEQEGSSSNDENTLF